VAARHAGDTASTFGSISNLENDPESAISFCCLEEASPCRLRQGSLSTDPSHSQGRTSATITDSASISTFTGLEETAATIAATCSAVSIGGA
jgi:hypothetical protein